jgi:hypothetical protein
MDKYKTLNMNYVLDCDSAINMAKMGIISAIIGNVSADNWEKYFSNYLVYGPTGDCIYDINVNDKIGFLIPPNETNIKKIIKTDYDINDDFLDSIYTTEDGISYRFSDFINEYHKQKRNR